MGFGIKHLLFFILFFILFYFEPNSIGSLKFSILWKIPLIFFILLYVSKNFINKPILPIFILFGVLFSIKSIIYVGPYDYLLQSFIEVMKYLTIPLFTYFFIIRYSNYPEKAYSLALTLSVYVVFSVMPFLLGILVPVKKGYDLSMYGLDASGFIGLFQNPHSAALVLTFALIVILKQVQIEKKNRNKIFFLIMLCVGIFALYQTYVRTGYLIFIIAFIYIFYWRKSIKTYLKHIPLFIILLVGFFYLYQSSDVLQMRLSDKTIYTQDQNTDKMRSLGSGRITFAITALSNWSNSDFFTIMLGYGYGNALDYMEQSIGARIFSHNGFVDIIQMNGLIGIFLYLLFIIYLYLMIHKNKKSKYYQLSIILYMSYIFFMILQGGHFFLPEVILSAVLAVLYLDANQLKRKVQEEYKNEQ